MGWFNGVDLRLVIAYPFNQSAVDVGTQCAFGLSINRCSIPVHSPCVSFAIISISSAPVGKRVSKEYVANHGDEYLGSRC